MSKETFIDGDKTLIDTDYYLKLLNCEQENQKLKEELDKAIKQSVTDHKYASECEDKVITYKSVLDEIRDNLQNSIDSINDKLSDKEIRVENGIIVNPINDYRIVRLKAIRIKCKELLQISNKVN